MSFVPRESKIEYRLGVFRENFLGGETHGSLGLFYRAVPITHNICVFISP